VVSFATIVQVAVLRRSVNWDRTTRTAEELALSQREVVILNTVGRWSTLPDMPRAPPKESGESVTLKVSEFRQVLNAQSGNIFTGPKKPLADIM
jgi:hypothetical protein